MTRRRRSSISVALALALALALACAVALAATTACGGADPVTQQTMPRLVGSDVKRDKPSPAATASAAEAAVGLQEFGHRLLSEHPELLDGVNGVVSPASIGVAFAMLRAGAEGETAEQFDDVFGFPTADVGPAYNALTSQWAPDGEGGPELSVANSLFVGDDFELKQPFLDALARLRGRDTDC